MGKHLSLGAIVFALVALAAACVPPGTPGVTTTVTPAHKLADGQLVTVTGTGLPANTDVVVVQCTIAIPTPDNCDLNAVQFLLTDGNGSVTTQYFPNRKLITGAGNEVDCAVPNTCEMAVSDLDVTTYDATGIDFDPNAPLAQPLKFSATIDNDGQVLESAGVVVLHGELTCNRGAVITIDGRLSQAFGRFLFHTDFETVKTCPTAGTFGFGFFVLPDNGLYAAGAANVTFSAFGIAGTSSALQASSSHAVTLTALPETPANTAHVNATVQANTPPKGVVNNLKSSRTARSGTHW